MARPIRARRTEEETTQETWSSFSTKPVNWVEEASLTTREPTWEAKD